uniref:Uncharacterized protein n=1 Tax=Heterorhabditis bacteriophora TaxID=37862 RepID=A0A1I7XKQ7_HETBA
MKSVMKHVDLFNKYFRNLYIYIYVYIYHVNNYHLSIPGSKALLFTATAVGMCLGPIPLYWAYKLDTKYRNALSHHIHTFK